MGLEVVAFVMSFVTGLYYFPRLLLGPLPPHGVCGDHALHHHRRVLHNGDPQRALLLQNSPLFRLEECGHVGRLSHHAVPSGGQLNLGWTLCGRSLLGRLVQETFLHHLRGSEPTRVRGDSHAGKGKFKAD